MLGFNCMNFIFKAIIFAVCAYVLNTNAFMANIYISDEKLIDGAVAFFKENGEDGYENINSKSLVITNRESNLSSIYFKLNDNSSNKFDCETKVSLFGVLLDNLQCQPVDSHDEGESDSQI